MPFFNVLLDVAGCIHGVGSTPTGRIERSLSSMTFMSQSEEERAVARDRPVAQPPDIFDNIGLLISNQYISRPRRLAGRCIYMRQAARLLMSTATHDCCDSDKKATPPGVQPQHHKIKKIDLALAHASSPA